MDSPRISEGLVMTPSDRLKPNTKSSRSDGVTIITAKGMPP
jgi:hypothetical protein